MTRRSRRDDRSIVAARSKTARSGLTVAELRALRRRNRNGAGAGAPHPAPIAVAIASTLAVTGAWVVLMIRPAVPETDTFSAVAAASLLAGYLFQLCWAIYVLPVAPLYPRLTVTGHTPARHSWALWVLPASVPLLVAASITPGSLSLDSFSGGMPVMGVLALHVLIFTIVGLAAVLGWLFLVAPVGLFVASFLPHRTPRGGSVFGTLSAGQLRRAAALPVSLVGFAVSMANVSDEGTGRHGMVAAGLREFVTLTGEPWAIAASWLFLGLLLFFGTSLARSARRAAG
jgi:hypothetical protein